MVNNEGENKGRRVAGYDFTVEARDGLDKVDVTKWSELSSRFEKADPKFVAEVRKGFLDLRKLQAKENDLAERKKAAEAQSHKVKAEKIDRQIKHNKNMIESRKRELQVAHLAGHRGQSFDRQNQYSRSGKGRTDVETAGNIVESTVGKNKKRTQQLKDHAKKAEAEGKNANLDAKNMKKDGIQHGKRHGMKTAQSDRELSRNMSQNEKIDPQKVKAAQERNAAKKEDSATKTQQQKAKADQTQAERMKAVQERAENAAKKRGADEAAAKKAGEDRVKHVQQKMALNAERVELRKQGTQLPYKQSEDYFKRDAQFREQRQKDLAQQAKQENRSYQGPPEKPKELREVETKILTREFTERTRLDGYLTPGHPHQIDTRTHQKKSDHLEAKLTEYRKADMNAYHNPSQTQTYTASHTQSSGQSHSR